MSHKKRFQSLVKTPDELRQTTKGLIFNGSEYLKWNNYNRLVFCYFIPRLYNSLAKGKRLIRFPSSLYERMGLTKDQKMEIENTFVLLAKLNVVLIFVCGKGKFYGINRREFWDTRLQELLNKWE